jgi:hypothetical protein
MVLAAEFFRVISPIVSIVSSPEIFWQGPGSPEALPND